MNAVTLRFSNRVKVGMTLIYGNMKQRFFDTSLVKLFDLSFDRLIVVNEWLFFGLANTFIYPTFTVLENYSLPLMSCIEVFSS